MYSQIDKNKTLSCFLLLGFVFVTVAFTFLISFALSNDGVTGFGLAFLALIISLISGLVSYYGGAAIVLSMTGAKEVTNNPNYQDLNQRVEILSIKAGIPKPKIYILPDMALNAFATGRDPKNAHIAITQGLIEKFTTEELEGVIAHEMGHIKNYDIRLMLIVSVLAGVLTYLADFFLRGMFFSSRGKSDDKGSNPIIMIAALVLAILAPIIAAIIQLAISRRREFLADITAVEITRYPQGMINALKKLQADDTPVTHATSGNAHMFIDFPLKDAGGFLKNLFSTHPKIEDRIKALENI